MKYLAALARIDELQEVNFMQLLRHGSFVTSMSENEVISAIAALTAKGEEQADDHGDSEEIVQMFSALLFARMAELNGPEALRMVMAGEFGEMWEGDEDELIPIGMGSWVDADPEGAFKWFQGEGMKDPKMRELFDDSTVQSAFFAAMARHDPTQALQLAQETGEELSSDSIEVIARYEESVEGLENMLAQTAGEVQLEVFNVMSERDPKSARQWLEQQSANTINDRDPYVASVAENLMAADQETGIEWYMNQEISSEEGTRERFRTVVNELADSDPAAAAEWLAEQADVPARDAAELQLARDLARAQSWSESFRWAAELSSPQQQSETANWILRRGWDRATQSMSEEVSQAAQGAGFESQLRSYLEKNTPTRQ